MKKNNPWKWVPSLYFIEGLPYIAVMSIATTMYKKLDVSNTDIALYTSWLYLPWVIKPLWSPIVDLLKNKRWWIITMQFLMGVGMAGIAFTIPVSFFFQATLSFFWLLAFSSATHDIAADGFYLIELNKEKQAFFIGIRNIFYRLSMITGQGLLVILAGWIEETTGNIPFSWTVVFIVTAGILFLFACYHKLVLPRNSSDKMKESSTVNEVFKGFRITVKDFFTKKGIVVALVFILTYRLGESQLVKLCSPFLLDDKIAGGLELSTKEAGLVYGTVGVIALMLGGILGGFAISRDGLKKWIWPMALSLTIPSLAYVYLAYVQPDNFLLINLCVAFEQFGYGFGFTAYTMFLMLFSRGKYSTSHYAFCTGLMALGMMLPGMVSGWIQSHIGYFYFFIWTIICAIPGLFSIAFLKIRE